MTYPINLLSICLIAPLVASFANAQNALIEKPQWRTIFTKFDAIGTAVVVDRRGLQHITYVYNPSRAATRMAPASTYKIPHTLFALDAGVLTPSEIFHWDGIKRSYAPHNKNHDIAGAMKYSVVWVYNILAERLGNRAQQYLTAIGYGNENPVTEVGSYWIEGKLAISALEQVEFLERLHDERLPFNVTHQQLVKNLLLNEKAHGYTLRAKTGWHGQYGWWIGWIESVTGPVFFALNLDTPRRSKDLYKRQAITKEILRTIDALPVKNKSE